MTDPGPTATRRSSARAFVASGLAMALGATLLLPGVRAASAPVPSAPRSPIKHLVVIFQENHSFDVYFAHLSGGRQSARTSRVSTRGRARRRSTGSRRPLIERNPNSSKPFRIDRTQSYTCDQDHEYTAEQRARNGGLMDQFPRFDAQPPTNAAPVLPQGRRRAVGHGDGVLRRQHRHRATGTTRSTSRSATTASRPCPASRRAAR